VTKPKDKVRKELASCFVTPFRCSRGHLILVTRPKSQAQPGNCDRRDCQDNSEEPVQCGPRQRATIIVWSDPR